jgi:hypothetical protein
VRVVHPTCVVLVALAFNAIVLASSGALTPIAGALAQRFGMHPAANAYAPSDMSAPMSGMASP